MREGVWWVAKARALPHGRATAPVVRFIRANPATNFSGSTPNKEGAD
jgi:hypothetical protein